MTNDLIVYQSDFGEVQLTADIIRKQIATSPNVTDEEIVRFVRVAERLKLDPFVQGEIFLVKYGTQPAQIIVGYRAYVRKAYDNPSYISKQEGLVVQKGSKIDHKEGQTKYPGEVIIGGWCRVKFIKHGKVETQYKEVSFEEYNTGNSNWVKKPGFMICKVAMAQALRDTYPSMFAGTYIEEEITNFDGYQEDVIEVESTVVEELSLDMLTTKDQQKFLYKKAEDVYGKEAGIELLIGLMKQDGFESSKEVTLGKYNEYVERFEKDEAELEKLEKPKKGKKDE